MGENELERQIAAATAYQDLFVPALFEEWAPRVATAARVGPGDRVLDVACGTGVLTREVASRVGPAGAATGLDISPAMLAVAGRIRSAARWQQGSADALPFEPETFDAVVSQFGLMFFPDQPRSVGEMIRVLVPGGRLALAVWASLEDTPIYAAEVALVEEMAGPAAADVLRAPFSLGDPGRLAAVFARAGIGAVEITLEQGTGHFPSIRFMVEADLRGWLPLRGVHLSEPLIIEILDRADEVLRPFVAADGTVRFASPAIIAAARKPAGPPIPSR